MSDGANGVEVGVGRSCGGAASVGVGGAIKIAVGGGGVPTNGINVGGTIGVEVGAASGTITTVPIVDGARVDAKKLNTMVKSVVKYALVARDCTITLALVILAQGAVDG